MQHDNDLKHSSKSTTEWLKKKRVEALQWPSQSPDLGLTEMLSWDFKNSVHKQILANFNELKHHYKEKGAKSLLQTSHAEMILL